VISKRKADHYLLTSRGRAPGGLIDRPPSSGIVFRAITRPRPRPPSAFCRLRSSDASISALIVLIAYI